MSEMMIGFAGVGALIVLLFAGMPIAFSLGLVGFIGMILALGANSALTMLGVIPFTTVTAYTMSVVPLFVLMGEFAAASGMTQRAFGLAEAWLSGLRGGLAMATIVAGALFGAVSGSSLAGAATLTRVTLPEMDRRKYDRRLSTGSIAAGGTLSILIPPSIALIIYSTFTLVSIGRLFIAGIIPGIIVTMLFMVAISVTVKIVPSFAPTGGKVISWGKRFRTLKDAWGVLLLGIVVLGGLWGGVFTPTEAGGIGAIGAFTFALVMARINIRGIISVLQATSRTCAFLFAILIGAMIFNNFMTVSGMPVAISMFIERLGVTPMVIMIGILFLYLFLGTFISCIEMQVLTIPILFPIAVKLGFDGVWFGIIVVLMSETAMITPPVGMNVFVIKGVAPDVPMYTIFRGVAPFVGALAVAVVLLLVFPQLATFLPGTMIGV